MAVPAPAVAFLPSSRWSSAKLWQGGTLYNYKQQGLLPMSAAGLFTITERKFSSSEEDVFANSKCCCIPMRRVDHFLVRSTPRPHQEEGKTVETDVAAFFSQEDLKYLWQLAVGSVGGAALIKYGSILFPEITRPNILQAILIIGMPVLVSIYLLIRQSRVESQNQDPL